MKIKSRLVDAFLGLLLTLAVTGGYFLQQSPLESLELRYFDLRTSLIAADVVVPQDIVIIEIDEESVERIGAWPWPRTYIADLLLKLGDAEPRVIGLNILYSENSRNPAFKELTNLETKYTELLKGRQIIQRKGVTFEAEFSSAAKRLDADAHLLDALARTPNVVLPMYFKVGGVTGGRPPAAPIDLSKSSLSILQQAGMSEGVLPPLEATRVTYPIPSFLHVTTGTGHVNVTKDLDGKLRRETPVIKYGVEYFPSFALQLVTKSMALASEEIEVVPGQSIRVGNMTIPLDETQSMVITYNGAARTFRYFKYHEVMSSGFEMGIFKDKIVLVGNTVPGIDTPYVTPLSLSLPSMEYVANVVENILNNRYITRPKWGEKAELGAIAFIGLFVMLVLPRLGVVLGLFLTTLLMTGLLGAGFYFFNPEMNPEHQSHWLKVVYPAVLLGIGYVVIMVKNFFTTEQDKERVEGTQADTNKQLGLTLQSQGMLDPAFEKLRTCPIDESMKETLYNLGSDFERKRQFAKAVSVYEHIAKEQADFKDIEAKIKTLRAAAEGAVFGGVGVGGQKEGTIFAGGGASKPTLGRYEIEKELGRGAMGVVYLGKDPKINRQVAIKTLLLEEGDDPKETKEVKERFFREAESAGTLNHPGIVRIFDAGEDNDLCWIAMELLSGEDFVGYTKKEKLLPPEKAMDYVALVAEALDYAHAQGIVHRDIKPANIMLLKDGSVRVTDFGIARITASSKTATGTIMGTPSYMSPDQVSGKKVDGRSDLFSLGVTLFEFLCGEKPFKGGEGGIGPLLFQIANDPEADILAINPALPVSVKDLIGRALKKKPEERFQTGKEMAEAIRACLTELKGGAPVPATEPESIADQAASDVAGSLVMSESAAEPAPEPVVEPAPEPPVAESMVLPEIGALPEPAPEPTPEAAPPTPEVHTDLNLDSTADFLNDLGTIAGAKGPNLNVIPPKAKPVEVDLGDAQAEDIAGSLVMPDTEPAPEPVAEPAPEPEPLPEPVPESPPEADSDKTFVLSPGQNFGGGGDAPSVDLLEPKSGGGSSAMEISLDFDEPAPPESIPEPIAEPISEPSPEPSDETIVMAPVKPREPAPVPEAEPTVSGGLELPPEEFNADETFVLSPQRTGGGFTPEQIANTLPEPVDPVPEPSHEDEKTIRITDIDSILGMSGEESTASLDDEITKVQKKLSEQADISDRTASPPDLGGDIQLSDPDKKP